MYCQQYKRRNYRIISVMFWAFPYLLWQAFGHISGFFVGLVLAVILTTMFNSLLRADHRQAPSSSDQSSSQTSGSRQWEEARGEIEPYQRGYRAQSYRTEQPMYQAEESPSQYEEMQVQYPQEMPPMEQH